MSNGQSLYINTAQKICYGVSVLGITALGLNGQRAWALPSGGNVIHGDIKLEQVRSCEQTANF